MDRKFLPAEIEEGRVCDGLGKYAVSVPLLFYGFGMSGIVAEVHLKAGHPTYLSLDSNVSFSLCLSCWD